MPSIFDDINFIKKLAAIGASSLEKKGQKSDATSSKTLELAKKLLLNLQRQIDPEKTSEKSKYTPLSSEIKNESLPSPNLMLPDVRSLGDFLRWAAKNELTWENKRIAWVSDKSPNNEAWQLSAKNPDRNRDSSRNVIENNVWFTKDALIGYLSYLRDSVKDRILKDPIKQLINELNIYLSKLPDEKLVPTDPQSSSTLNPKIIIDAFPNKIITQNDGLNQAPNFYNFIESPAETLRVENISSYENFISWLKDMSYNNISALDPSVVCSVVNILYVRSKILQSRATKNYKAAVDLYQKNITEFGPQLTDASGSHCTITSLEKKSPQQTDQTVIDSQTFITELLNQDNLALEYDYMDIGKISAFINMVSKLNDPNINADITQTKTAIASMSQYTNNTRFPIKDDNNSIRTLIDENLNKTIDASYFYHSLISIVYHVSNIYKTLYNRYEKTYLNKNNEQIESLKGLLRGQYQTIADELSRKLNNCYKEVVTSTNK